jgi:hypothetical protein
MTDYQWKKQNFKSNAFQVQRISSPMHFKSNAFQVQHISSPMHFKSNAFQVQCISSLMHFKSNCISSLMHYLFNFQLKTPGMRMNIVNPCDSQCCPHQFLQDGDRSKTPFYFFINHRCLETMADNDFVTTTKKFIADVAFQSF